MRCEARPREWREKGRHTAGCAHLTQTRDTSVGLESVGHSAQQKRKLEKPVI